MDQLTHELLITIAVLACVLAQLAVYVDEVWRIRRGPPRLPTMAERPGCVGE